MDNDGLDGIIFRAKIWRETYKRNNLMYHEMEHASIIFLYCNKNYFTIEIKCKNWIQNLSYTTCRRILEIFDPNLQV